MTGTEHRQGEHRQGCPAGWQTTERCICSALAETDPVSTLPSRRFESEPYPHPEAAYEQGVNEATARIVAWLRQQYGDTKHAIPNAASAIERGDHLTGKELA